MKKKKLLEIADMLMKYRKNKKVKFDMDTWMSKNKCGTVCCAIGMAKLKGILPETFGINTFDEGKIDGWRPGGIDSSDHHKLSKYFKISFSQSEYLFDPDHYPDRYFNTTPKQVAKRIREFIKEK